MNIPAEKLIEMYGRLAIERDLLAAENDQLRYKLIEMQKTDSGDIATDTVVPLKKEVEKND